MQNVSKTVFKANGAKDSLTKNNNEKMERLEREADIQSKQVELNDCLEFVSELVNLFMHTIIIPELQREHDWHDDHGHQLKQKKGNTGNGLLDEKVQKIALQKGLTKEQWKRLLYVSWTTVSTSEMSTVSKNHLKKVHDMALRQLESDEQATVFALINAIEKHMPGMYYTVK